MSKKQELQKQFEEQMQEYLKKLEELSVLQQELFDKAVEESQRDTLAQARAKLKDL